MNRYGVALGEQSKATQRQTSDNIRQHWKPISNTTHPMWYQGEPKCPMYPVGVMADQGGCLMFGMSYPHFIEYGHT